MPKSTQRITKSKTVHKGESLKAAKVKAPVARTRMRNGLSGGLVKGLGLRRGKALISEITQLTGHTIQISKGVLPLVNLLAHDRDIHREELGLAIEELFDTLYEHPITQTTQNLTDFLRQRRMIPNEQSTENLIRFVVDQMVARSPVEIPEPVLREFWNFFEELFSSPEIKGLGEMSLDMVRLVLRTYEPMIVEVINLLKAGKRFNEWQLKELMRRAAIVSNDVKIIRRQIKALRYIRPFFQADPKDFKLQAEIVAQMVKEFGPFFVKMAQIAAANSDFLPKEIAKELAVFQEDVPPMSPEEVIQAFMETFGKHPDQLYMDFDASKPIRSGSIGSIYIAKKPFNINGEEVLRAVVVKVGRHNLDREFVIGKLVLNLAIMSTQYWAPHSKLAPFLQALQDQVDEFVKGFTRELNFEEEARVQRLFYERSRESVMWNVPILFTSSTRILEMEYIEDANSLVNALQRLPARRRRKMQKRLAERFLYSVLYQLVVYQECHGDLHPGNVMVGPDGELHLIDWGNSVNMDGKWAAVWNYLVGAVVADRILLTEALIKMSTDPQGNRERWDEIHDLLGETLDKRGIKPLKAGNFLFVLTKEGLQGLHQRAQTVMQLAANSQQLGIVLRSDYMHLSRSLFAAVGSFGSIYEDSSKLLLLRDLASNLIRMPLILAKDKIAVKKRDLQDGWMEYVPQLAKRGSSEAVPVPIHQITQQ